MAFVCPVIIGYFYTLSVKLRNYLSIINIVLCKVLKFIHPKA